ncbi:ubiquinone biosynthesis accessory factor UbiJ [Parvibium lacunae]|nr:SCP2 sterol-binding domain-containing protein [Parvibium lacunae]
MSLDAILGKLPGVDPAQMTASMLQGGAAIALRLVNHVLQQEPWATVALQAHAGKIIQLTLPRAMCVCFCISAQGLLEPAQLPTERAPTLSLRLREQDLSAWLAAAAAPQTPQLMRLVVLDGDAELAQLIGKLVQTLRWDIEHDLAQWLSRLGPLGAPLLPWLTPALATLRKGATEVRLSWQRSFETVQDYVAHEQGTLLTRQQFHALPAQLQDLRERLDRLEKRVVRQESRQSPHTTIAGAA